jgi:sucrose phosphorylase
MLTPDQRARLQERLALVYGPARAPEIVGGIEKLLDRWRGHLPAGRSGWDQRDALLITYADTLLGARPPLAELHDFLRATMGRLLSFVHLLPFYPYSSDDGFAVEDFRTVREDLGDWADVERLAGDYRLVVDGVINHVSASSVYMEGYRRGDPAYDGFFHSLDPETDTSAVLRTRNLPLLHDYRTARGTEWLWTTFSRDQVDLNFATPAVLLEILDVLLFYAARGAAMIRLDAIPYLWKELGTSCAHLPQTHELIKLMRDILDLAAPHVLLLTETNVPHHENVSYFGDRGDEAQMIYNFSLPPLILWSLVDEDASVLTDWAGQLEVVGPRATYLNITATHDGIGMRPTEGILSEPQRQRLVDLARARGGDVTGKRNPDGSVSPYELNLNYYDAVNDPARDEPEALQIRRFLLSQSIPLALVGLPGIYIHSLLGSRSDVAGVERTGRARSINRAQLPRATLEAELADPASRRARILGELRRRLALRAAEPCFHPDAPQTVLDLGPALFAVRREAPDGRGALLALHNVTTRPLALDAAGLGADPRTVDLLTGEALGGGSVGLAPCQVRWLRTA